MEFIIIGPVRGPRTIAVARQIREFARLVRAYGKGRWRKRAGIATLRLADATVVVAEVHWYEAHGLGRHEFKIKRVLRGDP